MTTIYCKDTGRELNTRNLPDCLEPLGCGSCGNRVAWLHTGVVNGAAVVAFCDDCAATMKPDDDPLNLD